MDKCVTIEQERQKVTGNLVENRNSKNYQEQQDLESYVRKR